MTDDDQAEKLDLFRHRVDIAEQEVIAQARDAAAAGAQPALHRALAELDRLLINLDPLPGLVTAFKPTAIEYVLKDGEEDDEQLLVSLEKRGLTPVKVIRQGEGSEDSELVELGL